MKKTQLHFIARNNHQAIQFHCALECKTCRVKNTTNPLKRCSRTVCIGLPYCWQHLQSKYHLKIKLSEHLKGAEKGLYAYDPKSTSGIVFQPNQKIVRYIGQKITQKQLDKRYDYDGHNVTAPYAAYNVDAACKRGVASLANDSKPSSKSTNARFIKRRNGHIYLYALKPIRHGDEILVDYGESYWEGHSLLTYRDMRLPTSKKIQ